uniref:Uncharacterized protein n=1 Tax=Sphingomonas sp. JE1 TaxID=1628059 RepID=A0A0D4ZZM8_9SPHN|nr:hypothetical protein pJE1_0157 [Sphingomonas sp. JE1]
MLPAGSVFTGPFAMRVLNKPKPSPGDIESLVFSSNIMILHALVTASGWRAPLWFQSAVGACSE